MSVFAQGNIMQSFIVKAGTSSTIPAASADLLATLADSQVVAVGKPVGGSNEQVIQAGASAGTYDYFRLAQKVLDPSGNSLLNYGPIVRLANNIVVSAATKTYAAPAEQVYYVGYNGTSGSLDVSQSNEFIFTIAYDHDDMMWSEQKLRNSYDYYSAAPTQQGLAMSMTSQINYKENLGSINGTGRMVIADMLAQGSSGGFTGTLAVTNNSTTITAASAQSWTVGQVIRIGTAATSSTDPAYVISSVTSSTVAILHMPYQGATNSAVAAANVSLLSAVTNYGFRVTGQPLTFTRDFFKYNKVKFHFDIKGFGATNYDRPGSLGQTATAPLSKESYKGVGSWQEVSEYESFSMGNEGALNRMVIPIPPVRGYASSSNNYDVIAIANADYSMTSNSSIITGNNPMRIQQFVFVPTSGAVRTSLASQLNGLLGASL